MILLDLNSLGFAAAASTKLSAGTQPTQAIFGVIKRIRELRSVYAGRIMALHDGRSWRYDEFSNYKGHRKIDPKLIALKNEWKAQKGLTARAIRLLGVDQLFAENMEADDLAARLVPRLPGPVVLVSGDKDWLQLVSERVLWVDLTHDRKCHPGNFKEMTGFDTPLQFVQAKALGGDQGDGIPPVGGIGPVGARWIFDNFNSVNMLLELASSMRSSAASGVGGDSFSAGLPKKIRDFVSDPNKIETYQHNLRLVWLHHPYLPAARNTKLVRGTFDRDRFTDLCAELSFGSLLADMNRFLLPFNQEERLAA